MFQTANSVVEKLNILPFTNLYVKRDDLIDPFVSGNKWRKLKYIIEKALRLKKSHLVTFGGAYSNHVLATSAAAAKAKLKCTAFIRGESVSNEMLFLCKIFGTKLIFVSRTDYKDKSRLFGDLFGNDTDALFIDEGGASEEALIGCAEIIGELPTIYDHIFCAAGTGTTVAGLLDGITSKNQPTKIHAINVLKNGEELFNNVSNYTENLKNLIIHKDYHFGGYAKVNDQLVGFIKNFTTDNGILIDPVYTAKMFYSIIDLEQKGAVDKNDKILAIHTGGLLGLMGMKDKF